MLSRNDRNPTPRSSRAVTTSIRWRRLRPSRSRRHTTSVSPIRSSAGSAQPTRGARSATRGPRTPPATPRQHHNYLPRQPRRQSPNRPPRPVNQTGAAGQHTAVAFHPHQIPRTGVHTAGWQHPDPGGLAVQLAELAPQPAGHRAAVELGLDHHPPVGQAHALPAGSRLSSSFTVAVIAAIAQQLFTFASQTVWARGRRAGPRLALHPPAVFEQRPTGFGVRQPAMSRTPVRIGLGCGRRRTLPRACEHASGKVPWGEWSPARLPPCWLPCQSAAEGKPCIRCHTHCFT